MIDPTQVRIALPIATASPHRAARAGELRIGQFNVKNMFDTVDDPNRRDTVVTQAAYDLKLEKLAISIRDNLAAPDVLALQEVESQHVLDDLLKRPELSKLGYQSVLLPGNDLRGINVGMIYRGGTIDVTSAMQSNTKAVRSAPPRRPQPTVGATPTTRANALSNPGDQVDATQLFARPPLVVDAVFHPAGASGLRAAADGQHLTLIINHFKSKMGGPKNDARREEQATFVAGLVDARAAADPHANVIVIGDLNTNEDETSFRNLVQHADGRTRLTTVTSALAEVDRYSWGRPSRHYLFDHILVTGRLQTALAGAQILHFNTTAPKGSDADPLSGIGVSDHDPIIATFLLR
ncbi:MAG: nuclease [Thermoleophilia bacterium]|nr:nuclease [Thermoleophilia bacterium]